MKRKQPQGLSSFIIMLIVAGAVILILGIVLIVFVVRGRNGGSSQTISLDSIEPVTLRYWRAFDEEEDFTEIIDAYTATHPKVTIEYRKLRLDEYRDALLSAWAKGEGPDVFSVPNQWLGEFQPLITPLPKTLTVAVTEGASASVSPFAKGKTAQLIESATPSPADIQDQFVRAVADDVVRIDPTDETQKVYGLPLSMDTLALYVNRDILNQNGVAVPPATWTEMVAQAPKVIVSGDLGNIVQAGLPMGTVDNVDRYFDILSALMMQGLPTDESMGQLNQRGEFVPDFAGDFATRALNFYTDFANPIKTVYGWNETMADASQVFAEGKAAFFLGYAYHLDTIENGPASVNFSVAPLPQLDPARRVNYANYWVESVFRGSAHTDQAWDFIQYITSAEQVGSFLEQVKKPTARSGLVDQQKTDQPALRVFLDQSLTASSWYRGKAPRDVEMIFGTMITAVRDGTTEADKAISSAVRELAQLEKSEQ